MVMYIIDSHINLSIIMYNRKRQMKSRPKKTNKSKEEVKKDQLQKHIDNTQKAADADDFSFVTSISIREIKVSRAVYFAIYYHPHRLKILALLVNHHLSFKVNFSTTISFKVNFSTTISFKFTCFPSCSLCPFKISTVFGG